MTTSQSHSTLQSSESGSGHRERTDRHRSPDERRRHRRRRSTIGETDRLRSSRAEVPRAGRRGREEESSESDEDAATQSGSIEAKPARRKTRIIYVTERGFGSSMWKERSTMEPREHRDDTKHSVDSPHRNRDHQTRRESMVRATSTSPTKRSKSTRHTTETKPNIKRSNTTASSLKPPTKISTNTNSKRSGFLENIFGPSPHQHREPEKLVECLTCAEDIPRSKSAKLKCGHRMCNSCLKRIFKLSITDPQHMPPKCCTADYIPLKHVDRLFDINFKKTWNRKFQEYSTKNRTYCPGRRCGEWIKPADIHKEDGRKYGKCSRCKTKVCCLCNGKWHGSKGCPKDEETNQLLEAAKQAGWQRCYSCRSMVELKEGCNHMTCRCLAQFCMVCGDKWKTCDCPWFNYETVEEGGVLRMQLGGRVRRDDPVTVMDRLPQPVHARPRGPDYLDDIYRRRRQDHDEQIALRRFRSINMEDNGHGRGRVDLDRRIAGYGLDGVQEYDDNHTADMDQATAAASHAMGVARDRNLVSGGVQRRQIHRPVPLRRHTLREQTYNSASSTRPSERVVPRRIRRDYESEAAVHAPLVRTHERSASPESTQSRATLAGLRGNGRGTNRVSAWRKHVEPGVEPAEGVLSI